MSRTVLNSWEIRILKLSKILSISASEEGEIDSDPDTKPNQKSEGSLSSQLQHIRKLIDRTKIDYEKSQHKLAKIERAFIKAQSAGNKTNMKKCQKYKLKYEIKVNKLKETLKTYQAKKVKLVTETRGHTISQLKAVVAGVTKPQEGTNLKAVSCF